MYKPHTIDQYKVFRHMRENFVLENFLISPLSPSSLLLEDRDGNQIAFAYLNGAVCEVPIPSPHDQDSVRSFLKTFREAEPRPHLTDFESITKWWLDHSNPLSYQQALGLTDDQYRYFLSHPRMTDEQAIHIAASGLASEEDLLGLTLWYFDGHVRENWLGSLGIDGTGEFYGLTLRYGTPTAQELRFYLQDEYYHFMNSTD